MKRVVLLCFAAVLSAAVSGQDNSSAMKNGKIGNVTVATFQQANQKGNQAVASVKPNSTQLSQGDQQLMMEIASGGQLQLALSQAAVGQVQTPEAKMLAQSEVEEQTGVAAKLTEIASAKGFALPAAPDAKAGTAVSSMSGMTGTALDAYYVQESGVNGHVLLQQTMTKVMGSAKDPALKQLAAATLPVIKMHLEVSRAVSKSMGAMKATTGNN